MDIGQRIRWLRKQKNMTIEELGKAVGVARQTISRYETGAIDRIPQKKIESIASALSVGADYLQGSTLDSMIDSAIFDINKQKALLSKAKTEEERQEIEYALAVLEESYDDLMLMRSMGGLSKHPAAKQESDNRNAIQLDLSNADFGHTLFATLRLPSWIFWALKRVASDSGCTLEQEIEKIIYERITGEIEQEINSDQN